MKKFAKDIGAPDAIVTDASRAETSSDVKQFLVNIGTTLKTLEQGTPWSNLVELYVGLLKSSCDKGMKSADSPLRLWDYCIERRARIMNLTAIDNFKL